MENSSERYDVIVIGAGVAGLACAVKLLESGVKNILLLEGSDRLGGRIRGQMFEGHILELGAQWIHGTIDNPIYELSKLLNIVDERNLRERSVYYTTQDGTLVSEELVDKIFDKLENIFDNLEDQIENEIDESSDVSLGTLLDQGFVKVLKKLMLQQANSNQPADIELVKAIYKARVNEERHDNGCDDLHRLSAIGWNNYEEFDGNNYCRLDSKTGFMPLIKHLAVQVEKQAKIKLDQVVDKIDWSQTSHVYEPSDYFKRRFVRVHTHNRNNPNEQKDYWASFVVTTSSIGYLKENHHKLFSPKLPLNMTKAIENLGFGVVNKMFIIFDRQVLRDELESVQVLWRDDIEFNLSEAVVEKWNLENARFYRSLTNFEIIPDISNVLLCFTAGSDSKSIESVSDECLIDVLNEMFQRCFPKLNIPIVKRVIRSNWSTEQFARGSYTYIKTGSTINDCMALNEPLHNQVYFAGEATDYKWIGTVHGAYMSGQTTAERILKTIKN